MIKFERMSLDSTAKLKKKFIALGVTLAVCGALGITNYIATEQTAGLAVQKKELSDLQVKTTSLNSQADVYRQTILASPLKASELKNKEQLVIALGNCAEDAGCAITGLSSKTILSGDTITRYNFTFEVKGSLAKIAKVLSNIDKKDIHYAINELTLRQEADYLWLQRDIQDDITWWDISNISSAGGMQSRKDITAEEIMTDNSLKFYIDLDFIVINEVL